MRRSRVGILISAEDHPFCKIPCKALLHGFFYAFIRLLEFYRARKEKVCGFFGKRRPLPKGLFPVACALFCWSRGVDFKDFMVLGLGRRSCLGETRSDVCDCGLCAALRLRFCCDVGGLRNNKNAPLMWRRTQRQRNKRKERQTDCTNTSLAQKGGGPRGAWWRDSRNGEAEHQKCSVNVAQNPVVVSAVTLMLQGQREGAETLPLPWLWLLAGGLCFYRERGDARQCYYLLPRC